MALPLYFYHTRIAPHTTSFWNDRLHHWCLRLFYSQWKIFPMWFPFRRSFWSLTFLLIWSNLPLPMRIFSDNCFHSICFSWDTNSAWHFFLLLAKLDTHIKHLHHLPAFLVYRFFHHESKSETSFCFQMHTHTHARIHLKLPRIISGCKLQREKNKKIGCHECKRIQFKMYHVHNLQTAWWT